MSVTTAQPKPRTPSVVVLTGASHSLAFDSSILVGDAMLLVVEQLTTPGPPTTPAGWLLGGTTTHGTAALYVYGKVRQSGETSVTVTRAASGAGRAVVSGYGGVKADVSTWVFGTSRGRQTSPADSSTTTTALGITTNAPDTLAVSIFGERTAAAEGTAYVPSVSGSTVFYYAGQQSTADLETILLAHKAMPTVGATGNAVATYLNTQSSNSGAMMVGLPSAETDTTPQPVARLATTASDGAGNRIQVGATAWDGTTEVALAKIEAVHSGTFVPDLDRISRVWWMTHRGGSLDYQEHSARGYVESAVRHADVMEFSVGRTSDGIFFGLHDDTLNRTTSGLAANYKPGEHTWAEISQLVQDLPNRGDTRFTTAPYMRMDDFIAQWSPSHTLMFDPKLLTAAQRQELLARIQQIPDYRNRVLGKFYITGTDRADEFHSIGVKAWGYGYTADVQNGTMAAKAGSWDYLGLEWDAAADVWAETIRIAAGRIVIGHIVGTATQAQTAVSKGARALQVSGVRSVSTVY